MKNRSNNAVTTLVGADAKIRGGLFFGRGCHVAGLVQGDVLATDEENARLVVAAGARIEGNAQAVNMQIEGTVVGDLSCSGAVFLAASARVEGSIEYGSIEIAKGAVVTGSLKKTARQDSASGKSASVAPERSAGLAGGKPAPAAAG